MTDYNTYARLVEGRAEVQMGSRRISVSRRDVTSEPDSCPIELLVAALGS